MFTRIEVKASAYISLVRPLMEYACIVWDPYEITYINIVLKEFNIEQQDGLHKTTADLTLYQSYC